MSNVKSPNGFLDYKLGHSPEVIIVGMKPSGRNRFEDGLFLLCMLQSKDSLCPNAQYIVGALEVFVDDRRNERRVKERRKGEREYLNYKVSQGKTSKHTSQRGPAYIPDSSFEQQDNGRGNEQGHRRHSRGT